jgi:hypothetical protein
MVKNQAFQKTTSQLGQTIDYGLEEWLVFFFDTYAMLFNLSCP